MRLGRKTAAALVALAFVGVGGAIAPASADTASDGLWYYDKFHVKEAHDAGWTGKGVTIAVIDGGINPEVPTLKGSNVTVVEPSFCRDEAGKSIPATSKNVEEALHGTNVTAVISGTGRGYPGQVGTKGVAPGATVRFYADATGSAGTAVGSHHGCGAGGKTATSPANTAAFRKAIDDGVDIISVSSVGGFTQEQADLAAEAIRRDIIVVGGMPNSAGLELAEFPGGANGAIGVQAIDSSARVEMTDGVQHQNKYVDIAGPGVDILRQGEDEEWKIQKLATGTSYATPIVAGFLADVKQKYPKATANQIIQSMIRTTGGTVHEPERDSYFGYGVISLTIMLKTDPTQFPDVNPLVTKDADAMPTWEQIYGKSSPSVPSDSQTSNASEKAATSTSAAATTAAADKSSPNRLMVGGIAIGALVLVAGLIIIVILGVRASRNRARRA